MKRFAVAILAALLLGIAIISAAVEREGVYVFESLPGEGSAIFARKNAL